MRLKSEDEPMLDNYPALRAWLYEVNGEQLWQMERLDESISTSSFNAHTERVEGWRVNGHLVLVMLRSHRKGWDIFTSPDATEIKATLTEIERRLNIAPTHASVLGSKE